MSYQIQLYHEHCRLELGSPGAECLAHNVMSAGGWVRFVQTAVALSQNQLLVEEMGLSEGQLKPVLADTRSPETPEMGARIFLLC